MCEIYREQSVGTSHVTCTGCVHWTLRLSIGQLMTGATRHKTHDQLSRRVVGRGLTNVQPAVSWRQHSPSAESDMPNDVHPLLSPRWYPSSCAPSRAWASSALGGAARSAAQTPLGSSRDTPSEGRMGRARPDAIASERCAPTAASRCCCCRTNGRATRP